MRILDVCDTDTHHAEREPSTKMILNTIPAAHYLEITLELAAMLSDPMYRTIGKVSMR